MASARKRILRGLIPVANAVAGGAVTVLLSIIRACNRIWISNFFAAFMRMVGPRLREQRIGRANLKAAFPERPDAEIDKILTGVWDNLGRVFVEYAHLDRFWDFDLNRAEPGRIVLAPDSR